VNVNNHHIAVSEFPGMIVNQEYLDLLNEVGLNNFDNIYGFEGGQTVKKIKARSICRVEVPFGNETRTLFLKRHRAERPSAWNWIKGRLLSLNVSAGMTEFRSICDFRKLGISTALPIAAGERRVSPLRYESFLITESMAPFVSLESIIQYYPEQFIGTEGNKRKIFILNTIADLMRKMHDAGFNHLDFNADHVMIGPDENGGNIRLALLDFQRIDRRQWMRHRWMIKTMAEIFYTLPEPIFSDKDKLFIFEQYNHRPCTGLWDRFVLNWIIKKAKRIGKHTEKIIIKKQQSIRENHS
jgi:hypothetical protein